MQRPSGRAPDEMRNVNIIRGFTRHAAGSVLIEFGQTRVLCTASVDASVPPFLRGQGRGWVTAEYGMLPGATHSRVEREAVRGKQSGRTVEIQRLIGRSLRPVIDLDALGELTIRIDCDVLQADGGTRTASITGGCVALHDAVRRMQADGQLESDPLRQRVAAVSVGIYEGVAVLDLDYAEDSRAGTDMNVVMDADGGFVEIQGTAEGAAFTDSELERLLALARKGTAELIAAQQAALAG